MPAGKRTYIRYRIIDKCLSNRVERYWSIQQLLRKIEEHDIRISRRSLEFDIWQMRYDSQLGYFAPIVYSREKNGYYYTDPNYSILKIPVDAEDIEMLSLASAILNKYKGLKIFDQMDDMVERLAHTLKHFKLEDTIQQSTFIYFDQQAYYKGIDLLDPLLQAIKDRQPLQITYRKFDGTGSSYTYHPYFLKEYLHRWYLIGYHEEKQRLLSLALDRMEAIEHARTVFIPNEQLDPGEYFKHTIGVSFSSSRPEKIVLSFTPEYGNYIKTQHWHTSQKILADNGKELRIELEVVPNYELTALILSHGADVQVLQPDHLREKVKEILKKGWEGYEI